MHSKTQPPSFSLPSTDHPASPTLFTFLGRGSAKMTEGKVAYQTTPYFLQSDEDQILDSTFVGEALVRLTNPGTFGKVAILGTRNSKWHIIYHECLEALGQLDDHQADFNQIFTQTEAGKASPKMLKKVAAKFEELTGVPTLCRAIETGKDPADFWEIFETVAQMIQDNEEVHIDITLGLRYLSLFVVRSVEYVAALRTGVSLGKVYYGAFELNVDFGGKSPIMDLAPLREMPEWLQAANDFSRYGDLRKMIELAEQCKMPPAFISAAKQFSDALSLTLIHPKSVRQSATTFLIELHHVLDNSGSHLRPLVLLKDKLAELPFQILDTEDECNLLLIIAERLGNIDFLLGQAILTLWEAIIMKLEAVYQKDTSEFVNHLTLSAVTTDGRIKKLGPGFDEFQLKIYELKTLRNAFAHVVEDAQKPPTPATVRDSFRALLVFFRARLNDSKLAVLPQIIPFEEKKPHWWKDK